MSGEKEAEDSVLAWEKNLYSYTGGYKQAGV